jgi:hypothetical protein
MMSGKTRRNFANPLHYDFVITRMGTFGNSQEPIPTRLTLLRHDPQDPSQDELFLDRMPMPREAWHYDVADRVINWRGAYGSGHLHVTHDGLGALGNIGAGLNPCSVAAGARGVFDCDVALNTGAGYVSSGDRLVGFKWDTTSQAWKSADWIERRLQLTFVNTPGGSMEPGTLSIEFQDNQTEAVPWGASSLDSTLDLDLETDGQQMKWKLTFKTDLDPDPDEGSPSSGPASVYPNWMEAIADMAFQNISGVLQIDAPGSKGTLVGMQGVKAAPEAAGYFRTSPGKAPFGIFDAKLVIGGQPVATSRLSGTVVSWDDLEAEHQQRTGLPASGTFRVTRDGLLTDGDQSVAAQRLKTPDALAAIEQHSDLHSDVHARGMALRQALADKKLNASGLNSMNPFVQTEKQVIVDVVQEGVTQDLYEIVNSAIPKEMWDLLFAGKPQPTLTGALAEVASSPVDGVKDPLSWYETLATAVLTQGMARGSDPSCKNMNGPRAAAWLKSHVATSPVYHRHGQKLFHHRWQSHFDLTSEYLADQRDNKDSYAGDIDERVNYNVNDINANVIPDASNPMLKEDLIKQVKAVGDYAKQNGLYWAFVFFTWNTTPTLLGAITQKMQDKDGTLLTRLFQTNASVLTALDPSGFFTKQYMSTLNTFMATNVMMSMFGFHGDAMSFDLIKEYLEKFVQENLSNEDEQIRAAAAQIQEILAERNSDQMIEDCINALRNFAGATHDFIALPFVAKHFVGWFKKNYPKFTKGAELFGSLLIGGISALAIFGLILEFKGFDKLTRAQKTQLIANALQLGLQIVAAVVKRGVRAFMIFNHAGINTVQRAAAVSKLFVSGETDVLDKGLMNMGKSMARWLADNEKTVGVIGEVELFGFTQVIEDEVTLMETVFGRNLDAFMATRVGPVFILLGIGLSLYFIIENHEQGLALAGEILNIASGSLMIFAQAGAWAIEAAVGAEIITAEAAAQLSTFISAAGPLGILAALVGVGIMLYEMFKTPPDPVTEFVDQYVKPTDFYLHSEAGAIDYATAYNNPDQNKLLMVGFSLSSQGNSLTVGPGGSLGLGPATAMPNCVWQVLTDGLGLSRIGTIMRPDDNKPPVGVLLSLMSDYTVSFQPPMPPPRPQSSARAASSAPAGCAPWVLTQTWLSDVQGDAKLTSTGGFLASLDLTLQPVLPDAQGNYARSQAAGWLLLSDGSAFYDTVRSTRFTLDMSGMAPNFMRMPDLKFIADTTPMTGLVFAPAFGVSPSTPLSFAVTGTLPTFLDFHAETGNFETNGKKADPAPPASYSITAKNTISGREHSATAAFKIIVA